MSPPGQTVLDLGPQHPTRAGVVAIDVELDESDVIVAARVQPGFLHRAAEKLFEVRDYRQVLMLADRHDWQAPFSGELVAALACEQLLGLSAPPRAVWLRTLLAETARIGSHLGFLTWVAHASPDPHLAASIRAARERWRELMLQLSGNRLHPMLNRLGGVEASPDQRWCEAVAQWLDEVVALPLQAGIDALDLPPGLGVVTAEVIAQFGLSGPSVRSVGLERDLRRDPGYLSYHRLSQHFITSNRGDVVGRFQQFVAELHYSADLARKCLPHCLGEEPTSVKLSKIVKIPDDQTWVTIEAPLGIAGVHLVSRGGTTPWRLALRTPTFANMNAVQALLVGVPAEHAGAVVASMGYTIGDLDK